MDLAHVYNVVDDWSTPTHIQSFIVIAHSMSGKLDSTFCWFYQIAYVRCHVTEPLVRNRKFRAPLCLEGAHNLETSIRCRWPCRSGVGTYLTISDPCDRDLDLDCGKKLPACITRRPLKMSTDRRRVRFCKVISLGKWPKNVDFLDNLPGLFRVTKRIAKITS